VIFHQAKKFKGRLPVQLQLCTLMAICGEEVFECDGGGELGLSHQFH
jgi:hypothetical protein